MRGAQGREGADEQPFIAQRAGDLDRLLGEVPCRLDIDEAADHGGSEQRRGEQRGIGAGVRLLQRRREQREGLRLPGPRHPLPPQRGA